jgi:hypothetical protein
MRVRCRSALLKALLAVLELALGFLRAVAVSSLKKKRSRSCLLASAASAPFESTAPLEAATASGTCHPQGGSVAGGGGGTRMPHPAPQRSRCF